MRVAQCGVPAHGHTECFGGPLGLRGPRRGVAARSHLALRQIEDAHTVTGLDGLRERATARELDVVAMCRNREQVYVFTHNGVPRRDRASPPAPRARCRTRARRESTRRWRSRRARGESWC